MESRTQELSTSVIQDSNVFVVGALERSVDGGDELCSEIQFLLTLPDNHLFTQTCSTNSDERHHISSAAAVMLQWNFSPGGEKQDGNFPVLETGNLMMERVFEEQPSVQTCFGDELVKMTECSAVKRWAIPHTEVEEREYWTQTQTLLCFYLQSQNEAHLNLASALIRNQANRKQLRGFQQRNVGRLSCGSPPKHGNSTRDKAHALVLAPPVLQVLTPPPPFRRFKRNKVPLPSVVSQTGFLAFPRFAGHSVEENIGAQDEEDISSTHYAICRGLK
ncbi:hypothetical protein Q8A73_001048 [Channa argus]|nr:hypothetical protein Q8A73_001048 [Channa argus]